MKLSNILIICAILSSSSVLLVNGATGTVNPEPVFRRIVGIEKNSNEKRDRFAKFGPGIGSLRDRKKLKERNEKRDRFAKLGPGIGSLRDRKKLKERNEKRGVDM